jgi:hypothetical protein
MIFSGSWISATYLFKNKFKALNEVINKAAYTIGCPLSGVVYFGTIIFFTLLTWATIAVILIYYHEDF